MIKLADFAKNIFLSNFQKLKLPYKLTFVITYRCNLKCEICQIWREKSKKELSIQEIKKFFQKNNYFNWVDLTGGEIFLRDDLLEIIKATLTNCQNLYLLHFPTNGFLTEKIVADTKNILELSACRLIITISLDGPEDLHDKLRGIKGGWIRAVETYKKLKELKRKNFEIYFGMTLSGYNYLLIEETYQNLKKLIPSLMRNDLHFNIAHHSSIYYANSKVKLGLNKKIDLKLKEFNKQKEKRFSGVGFLESKYQKLIPKYLENKKSPLSCQALNASIFIDPFGNVYPCSIWEKKIANLKDFDFDLKKALAHNKISQLKKMIKANQCPGCWTPCEAYQTILGNLLR